MAKITLVYDAKNSIAKKTIDFILSLGVFSIEKENVAITEALDDVKNGRVNSYDSVDDFFKKEVN